MLYTLHYITDLFHICKIQWNIIKDEMRCVPPLPHETKCMFLHNKESTTMTNNQQVKYI